MYPLLVAPIANVLIRDDSIARQVGPIEKQKEEKAKCMYTLELLLSTVHVHAACMHEPVMG